MREREAGGRREGGLRPVGTPAEEQLRALAGRNIEVTAQDVPAARPVPLDELLVGNGS